MSAITTVETTAEVQLAPEQKQALAQAEHEVLRALEEYEIKIQSLAIAKIQLGRALLNMRQIASSLGVWEQWQRGKTAQNMMSRLGLGTSPTSIRRVMTQAELLGQLHYLPAGERPLSEEEKRTVEEISQNMSARAWDIAASSSRSAQHEILGRATEGEISNAEADEIRQKHQPQQSELDVKPRNLHLPAIGTSITVKTGPFEGVEGVVIEHESADLVYIQTPSGKRLPVMVGNLQERDEAPPRVEMPSNLKYAKDALAERAEAADMLERRMNEYWGLLMKVHYLIGEALNEDAIAPTFRGRFKAFFEEIGGN